MTDPIIPFPEQVDALGALTRAFAVHDRTLLVMACGTGKTFVGRWHAEAVDAQQVVVFLPSLSLIAQTLGEWRKIHGWSFEALVICSDPSTAAGAAERTGADGSRADVDQPYWAKARAMVTVDPSRAARFLRRKVAGRPQVVFSTYHSAPVVADALAMSKTTFDLAIYDEAHSLAGRPRAEFRTALDRRRIVARKRLFMTATPLTFDAADGDDVISMDNTALFGPRAHTVTFGEAIAAGRLCDYKVLVIASREGEGAARYRHDKDIPSALLDAVDQHGIRRMLTFHSRVARAEAFAELMDVVHTPGGNFIRAKTSSSKLKADERSRNLAWLGQDQDGQVRILSSARCLEVGIDVPSVDALMYADERDGVVGIVQSIGRVLRTAPGKKYGYVIIPVTLPADGDDDTNLAVSKFGRVWSVLRGLRSHDERLGEEMDRKVAEISHGRGIRPRWEDRIQFVLPDSLDKLDVHLRMVQAVGDAWERFYAATIDWAAANDGRRVGRETTHRGIPVGEWGYKQRRARELGMLSTERIRRLEEIPGWYWSREDADWNDTYDLACSYADAYGTIADNPLGESKFAKTTSKGLHRVHLGVWWATQCQLYRDGMLADDRARKMEKVPGHSWDNGLRPVDVQMIQALRLFVEFEKHPNVPAAHLEDGLPLGAWGLAVRRAKVLGQVPPALHNELIAACPRTCKGATTWEWRQADTLWRMTYDALLQFVAREGKLPTGRVSEEFAGKTFNIGMWCARLRYLQRRDDLEPEYVRLLEQVNGWQWEISLVQVEYGEPLDLGSIPHGTAKGIQKKCPCKPCLDGRRERDLVQLKRNRQLHDPVRVNRAAAHLARLEAAGLKRSLILAVSGLPLGVIRRIGTGTGEIERAHEARLLATTERDCRTAPTRVGSRGRTILIANEKVDAGPTWALIEDLVSRGLGMSWISRELGYTSKYVQLRRDVVSRRIADQIAELHRDADGLSFPHRNNITAPSLAELRRHQRSAA